MKKFLKKNSRMQKSAGAFLFVFALSLVAFLQVSPVSAAGETFKWLGTDKVQMSGGELDEPAILAARSDGTLYAYSVTLHNNDSGFCYASLTLQLSADKKTATFKTVGIPSVASAPGAPGANCSAAETRAMEAWKGSTVTVAPDAAGTTPETAAQKRIIVSLSNPEKKSDSPKSVKFTLKQGGKEVKSFNSNIGGNNGYSGMFSNVSPGTYQVCVDKVDARCQEVVKKKYESKTAWFGESSINQVIDVSVRLNVSPDDVSKDQKYGPYKLVLKDKDGKQVDSKNISFTYPACRGDAACGGVINVLTSASFEGVDPGKYKVCVGDRCVDAQKVKSVKLAVTLPLTEADAEAAEAGEGTEAVCSAGALGWVFCPLVDFMSSATQSVAGYLEGMLAYEPLLNSKQGDAIKAVWGALLAIANTGLMLAFLMVIFSQATSIGLSSYGIKKLLPKIAAVAILMNLSFFICAFAVDVANVVGSSVEGIMQIGIDEVQKVGGTDVKQDASGGQYAATIAVVLVALTASVVTGAIFLLLPVLVSAVMAILTAFLILAMRDVLITLLIIVSPLAFLAWILPNTDEWFTKWRKLFTAMLLLFPLIMAIFYGSVLMSNVILITGSGGADNEVGLMTNLIAFAVLTVPLFSLPFIMKSAGGVLDRLGVMVNNRNKGVIDRSRKKADEWKGNSTYQRGLANRKQISNEYKGTKFAKRVNRGGIAGIIAGGVAGNVGKAPGMRNTNFGSQGTRLDEVATAAEAEAFDKRVASKMKTYTIKDTGYDALKNDFRQAVVRGDQESTVASLRQLGTMGSSGREAIDELMRGPSGTGLVIGNEEMQKKIYNATGKEMYGSLVGSRGDVAKGGFNDAGTWESGKLSSLGYEQLATQDSKTLRRNNLQVTPEAAHNILNDSNLRSRIQDAEARAVFEERAALHTPPVTATASGSQPNEIIIPKPGSAQPPSPQPGQSNVQQQRTQGGNFNGPPPAPSPAPSPAPDPSTLAGRLAKRRATEEYADRAAREANPNNFDDKS